MLFAQLRKKINFAEKLSYVNLKKKKTKNKSAW